MSALHYTPVNRVITGVSAMSVDHEKLIDLMKPKYPINEKGICYGIAVMGMIALLADDFAIFKKRLATIHNIVETKKLSAKDFFNFLQEIEVTRVNAIQRYREKLLLDLHKNIKMNDAEFYDLLKKEKDNSFVKDFLEKRLHVDDELSQEQRDLADVHAFFEVLSIHFSPDKYAYLFPEHKTLIEQNATLTFSRGLPDKLVKKSIADNDDFISEEKKKPEIIEVPLVKKITSFVGMYDLDSLTEYFKELRLTLSQFKPPVTFLLGTPSHAITVAYDHGQWQMINTGDLSFVQCVADIDIANQVLCAFSENDFTTFNSEVFCHADQVQEVDLLLTELSRTEKWKELHSVESKKNLYDSKNNSLLYVALSSGNESVVRELFKIKNQKIDPNKKILPKAETPLLIAAKHGHIEIVKMLLGMGADEEQIACGMSPLSVAAMNGHLDVVKALLANGAEVDKITPGGTALLEAALFGRLDVVKFLLSRGADATMVSLGAVLSPLYAAAKGGHVEVVKILLENIKENPEFASNALFKAKLLEDEKAVNTLLLCGVRPGKEHLSFFPPAKNDNAQQVTLHVASAKSRDIK